MIDKINLLLRNERINYLLDFESDKNKVLNHLQRDLTQQR